jgi:hypothetical protein
VTEPHGLLRPAFQGDDGGADPALVASLLGVDGTGDRLVTALRTLATARVFVPVSAQLIQSDQDTAVADDKHAEMALVSIPGRDGRRAVPAFTSVAALLAWRPDLRPVPVEGARAGRTAVDDGAAALLVDPGQPTQLVVTGSDLERLAAVWTEATRQGES